MPAKFFDKAIQLRNSSYYVKRFDASAGSLEYIGALLEQKYGTMEFFANFSGNDPNDSLRPVFSTSHYELVIFVRIKGCFYLLINLQRNFLSLGVLALDFKSQNSCLYRIIFQKQVECEIGVIHASAGIEPRTDLKSNVFRGRRIFFADWQSGTLDDLSDPGSLCFLQDNEPKFRECAVFFDERHAIGDCSDRHEIQIPFQLVGFFRQKFFKESFSEHERDTHSREFAERVFLARKLRIDNNATIGQFFWN